MLMQGRVKIAEAFNQAIAKGEIGTVILWSTIMMFQVQTLLQRNF
jgi:hypothetical protein